MAERYPKFSFIGYLDQAVCDLIEAGLERRKKHGVSISSAPACMHADLYEVEKFLDVWSGKPYGSPGAGAAGMARKKRVKLTDEEKALKKQRVSSLLQVFCYFRSTYEVLIDADEHLSTLLGPADLLARLKALVHLPSVQLVPAIKYLVCWPMAAWLRQEMPEKPDGLPQQIATSPLNLFRGGRV